jgi:hypothetical protein
MTSTNQRPGGLAFSREELSLLALVATLLSCQIANTQSVSVPPPGATEPVFNSAANTSLFSDDFEAYGTTADMTSGPNAKYVSKTGAVALMNTGGDFVGGGKFARFDYSAAGAYANELSTIQQRSPLLDTASVVILSYGFRNIGTPYTGKELIVRDLAGSNRFVLITFGNSITPQSLQNCWYSSVYPYPPTLSSVPPRGTTPTWSRDGLPAVGGPSPEFMGGNTGNPAARWDTRNDGLWHRYTYRFTKERAGRGTGRLEGWYDGVKFMEYIGDDPSRCEYGQVWTWNASNTVWENDLYFVGTTSGGSPWNGGALVDMDGVRLWLP